MRLVQFAVVFCILPIAAWAQGGDDPVQSAIERGIPLLERAAAGSAQQRECFTCHSQALPILAISEARRHGFTVDEANFNRQLDHTFAHLDRNRDRFLDGKGTGGKADTAGYALWALAAGERPPDATTAAVAQYLLTWQADDDHWSCTSHRPPSEESDFTTTCLAIRGLSTYGTDEQQDRIAARIRSVRDWLIATPAEDNEDRVFRLWGLKLAHADEEDVSSAASELVDCRREDGGWSQLDEQTSDPYATATALVALHRTGSLLPADEAYQRGVAYLLRTQLDDGSWHVTTRSDPFQNYFETGFPHDEDQFISTAASGWAVMALLAALPADTVEASSNPSPGPIP